MTPLFNPPKSPPKSPVNKPAHSLSKKPLQSSAQSPNLRLLKNVINRPQINLNITKTSPKAIQVPQIAIENLVSHKRPNLVEPVKR